MHSSRKKLLLCNRFAKPLIDDLYKLLFLVEAMKYWNLFLFSSLAFSLWLDGRLASCSLSSPGFCCFFFKFCAKCVCFVLGLLVLFAGINESQLGEKEEIFCGSGVWWIPFSCVGRRAALKMFIAPQLFASLLFFVIRSSPRLQVFILSFKKRRPHLLIYFLHLSLFCAAFSWRRRHRSDASSSEQNQTSLDEYSSLNILVPLLALRPFHPHFTPEHHTACTCFQTVFKYPNPNLNHLY